MRYLTALALTIGLTVGTATEAVAAPSHMTGRCRQYEPLLRQYAPKGGWDVTRMSKIIYRESRCLPAVVNKRGRDTGLTQAHPITWSWLSAKFGVPMKDIQAWLKVSANNIRAAAAMCSFWRRAGRGCYWAWTVR